MFDNTYRYVIISLSCDIIHPIPPALTESQRWRLCSIRDE